jgi:CTP:molybdopterin cytidylyltransferase MocA
MGQAKLLLPWGQATVIECVLARWCASQVERIVVVARRGDEPLHDRIRQAQRRSDALASPPPPFDPRSLPDPTPRIELVLPASDPPDMKDSVRVALSHLREVAQARPDDVWLMAPADMPDLSSRVVDRLIEATRRFPGEILVPRAGGRRGHPVLFPFAFAPHVDGLGPSEGLNRLLERLPVRELEWPVEAADEAVPGDLDTPADYARAVESGRSRC